MSAPRQVHSLALRELHTALGARLVEHAGWRLPDDYGDSAAEYTALRGRAVGFDQSHRSRFLVTGTDALDVLRGAFSGHLEDLEEGRSMRALALDGRGQVRDLPLVARTGGIAYLVIGEPGQREETLLRLQEATGKDFDARVEDRTLTTCLVGLSGPQAGDTVREHLADALPARLQPLHCATFEFHGFRTLVIRVSETGEDGFVFMVAPAVAQHMVETLIGAGVVLAGRWALETARIETAIPAFLPDLETGVTPAEAGLGERAAIRATTSTLAAMLIDGEVPPATGTALRAGRQPVGQVRSSAWGTGVGACVALGLVDINHAAPGTVLDADGCAATIVAKPIFRRRG